MNQSVALIVLAIAAFVIGIWLLVAWFAKSARNPYADGDLCPSKSAARPSERSMASLLAEREASD